MPKIKWNVCFGLRNQDNFATKRVGNADLVEHIWISASAIANDDTGPIN